MGEGADGRWYWDAVLVLRRGLGLGPKSSLGRRIRRWLGAWVLCSARYPRQARV